MNPGCKSLHTTLQSAQALTVSFMRDSTWSHEKWKDGKNGLQNCTDAHGRCRKRTDAHRALPNGEDNYWGNNQPCCFLTDHLHHPRAYFFSGELKNHTTESFTMNPHPGAISTTRSGSSSFILTLHQIIILNSSIKVDSWDSRGTGNRMMRVSLRAGSSFSEGMNMKREGMPNPGGVYTYEYERETIFYFVFYTSKIENSYKIGHLRTTCHTYFPQHSRDKSLTRMHFYTTTGWYDNWTGFI